MICVMLVTMALIFTILPRIYDKYIIGTTTNGGFSNQVLSIAANITGHGGVQQFFTFITQH